MTNRTASHYLSSVRSLLSAADYTKVPGLDDIEHAARLVLKGAEPTESDWKALGLAKAITLAFDDDPDWREVGLGKLKFKVDQGRAGGLLGRPGTDRMYCQLVGIPPALYDDVLAASPAPAKETT